MDVYRLAQLMLFINGMTTAVFLFCCLDCRYKRWQYFASFTGMLLAFLYLKMKLLWPTSYQVVFATVFIMLYLRFFFKNKWSQLILVFILAEGAMIFGASIVEFVCAHIWGWELVRLMDWHMLETVYMMLAAEMLCCLFSVLFIVFWRGYLSKKDSNLLALLLFGGVQIFAVLYQPYITANIGIQVERPASDTILPLLAFVADIVLIYGLYQGEQKSAVQKAVEEVGYMQEIEKVYYQSILNRQKELYTLRAQFGMQLDAVASLVESCKLTQAQKVLGQMQQTLEQKRERRYCGHPVVNAVLSQKDAYGQKLGIALTTHLYLQENIPVQPIHLCNIFSNLLDNALRSNELSAKERRWIQVIAEQNENYLYIVVKNAAEVMQTEVREHHGYGQQILRDIVKLYDGNYEGKWENNVYTAQMILYFPQQEDHQARQRSDALSQKETVQSSL